MGQGKSHYTLIDWCTGREWPVNCMTVISAGWRSIMPFQRSSGRWTSQEAVAVTVGDEVRRVVVRKAIPGRKGLWASGWAALENEEDTTLTAIRVGVRILQLLFGLQLPLIRKPWITFSNPCNKVRGTYIFLKKSSCVFIIVSLWCCRWQYNNLSLQHLKMVSLWRNG